MGGQADTCYIITKVLLGLSNLSGIRMQNDAGEYVDLYIPRKCSATNNLIRAKDHASVQINIAEVDETTGRMTGQNKTFALCGKIRSMGEADMSLSVLAQENGIIAKNY